MLRGRKNSAEPRGKGRNLGREGLNCSLRFEILRSLGRNAQSSVELI